MTDKIDRPLMDQVGRWALVLGALAFGIFWEAALFNPNTEPPVLVALGIHGLSFMTIAFGLIQLERSSAMGGTAIGWTAVTLVSIGFLSFVVLAVGLLLLAVSLWRKDGWLAAPSVLVAGSTALLLSYLLGARVGTEDAPDPSLGAAVLFGAAGILIPTGLILISARRASIA